jgi:hypothetical protein
MQHKTIAPQQLPCAAAQWIPAFCFCSTPVTKGAEQCTYKSGDNKKMTQSPGPQMFSYEMCIQPDL